MSKRCVPAPQSFPELRTAQIQVSVMGDEKTQALTLRGLESARGFLQAKVAARLDTRYTPILKFVLDRGVKLSIETSAILRDLNRPPQDETAPAPDDGADDQADDDAGREHDVGPPPAELE